MKLNKKDILYIITLLALSFLFFIFNTWGLSLFDVDEPRYAEAAREMIESNNWITPYFNYVVRFDKPVFFYWLIAISYKILGVSEFAARLPSGLMATFTILSLFFFGRKFISPKFGFICALVTLSSLEFLGLARMSITDMTLASLLSIMLLCGFTAAHSEEPKRKYWWYTFYVFMGLAALTKGPIAIAVAVMVLAPYFILSGKFIEVFKTSRLIKGFLIFMLIAAPWYILVIIENGMPYVEQFFLTDNLKRFTSTVSGHKAPIYFFLIVVAVGFIPWCTYLPYAIYKYSKPIYLSFKNKDKNQKSYDAVEISNIPFLKSLLPLYNKTFNPIAVAYKDCSIEKSISLFALVWFLIIFVFFSLSGTKLLTYVLPLFPALGLLVGTLWYQTIEEKNEISHNTMLASSGFLVAVFLIASYLVVFQFNSLMPRDAKVLNLGIYSTYAALTISIGSISSYIFLYLKQRLYSFASIIIMMILLVIIALHGIVPKVNDAAQAHLNKLIKISNTYNNGKNTIITFGLVKPSIVFYTRRQMKHIEPNDTEVLQRYLTDKERIFIITRLRHLDKLSQFDNVYIIDRGRRFALVTNKELDDKINSLKHKGGK